MAYWSGGKTQPECHVSTSIQRRSIVNIPSVGQAPRRRKVCACTPAKSATAATIEQVHFILIAIREWLVHARLSGMRWSRKMSCCVPGLYKLDSYLDLHTSSKTDWASPSLSLQGSTVIPVACSMHVATGIVTATSLPRATTTHSYCSRSTPQRPG